MIFDRFNPRAGVIDTLCSHLMDVYYIAELVETYLFLGRGGFNRILGSKDFVKFLELGESKVSRTKLSGRK
jgi:hypothetical protein